uniref:MHC class I-like antigen recognition-like domain-containing protein n=1 Tax=Otus sunia TaxID=257818 RepID=A0A8C8B7H1_9STRI
MQPPDRLFLFLPLLFPGMWADPEEPQVFQILQTGFFTNSSSAEVFLVALLGDVPIFTLDPDNWSMHFHWPWALQATAEGDIEKIKGQVKPFLRNMVRYIHTVVWQAQRDYPFVIQIRAGCVLHPNRTSLGFMDVGEGGRDLITFEVERQRWEPQQPSLLAELASQSLTRLKAVTGVLVHLLSISCQSHILTLWKYGRADLERQGEIILTLAQPPQTPHTHWGQAVPHRCSPHPLALAPQSCPWPQSLPARPDQTSSCSFAASPASTHGPSAWLGCRTARRCHRAQHSTPVPSCPTQTSPTSSASPWLWPPMTGTAMPAACATAAWAPAVSSSRGAAPM